MHTLITAWLGVSVVVHQPLRAALGSGPPGAPGESQTATQARHGQGQDGEGAEWCGVCSNTT